MLWSPSLPGLGVPRCCQHTTSRRDSEVQNGESTQPGFPTGASDVGSEWETVGSGTNAVLTGLSGYLGAARVPLGEVRNPQGIWVPGREGDVEPKVE